MIKQNTTGFSEDKIATILNNKNISDFQKEIFQKSFSLNSKQLPFLNELKEVFDYQEKDEAILFLEKFNHFFDSMSNYTFRDIYIKYSFTLLNHEFLETIKNYIEKNDIKYIIEVGAGTGFFSFWLEKYLDRKVIAVDSFKKEYFENDDYFHDIETIDAIEYMNKQQKETSLIIMAWPNYSTPFAFKVLKALHKNNHLLYVGEGKGGCTADDDFFEELRKDEYVKIDKSEKFQSFSHIHDYPIFIKKK